MVDNGQNVQINPADKFFLPIDKLNKNIFDCTKQGSFTRKMIEDRRSKIATEITLSDADLNQFDRLIFCAACSELLAGNKIFTVRRIYRKIGGSHTLTEPVKGMILNSLHKLRNTDCEIDMTAINKKYHYTQETQETELKFRNYLLPCKSVEVRINGQTADTAFEFIDEPDLLKIAEMKKQFIHCDVKLLEVPTLRNTENTMKLKIYLLSRVLEIIGSHKHHKPHINGRAANKKPIYKKVQKLSKTILLETIFKQCGLSDADRNRKAEYRKSIKKILDHFKTFGLIENWRFEPKNGPFCAVEIDFKQEEKRT